MIYDLLSLIANQGPKTGSWKLLPLSFDSCYYGCCWGSSNNIVPHLVKLDTDLSLMFFFNDILDLLNSISIKRKLLSLPINFFIKTTFKLYFEDTLKMLKILNILFIDIVLQSWIVLLTRWIHSIFSIVLVTQIFPISSKQSELKWKIL